VAQAATLPAHAAAVELVLTGSTLRTVIFFIGIHLLGKSVATNPSGTPPMRTAQL
jgi:hypothetical protein